MRVEQLTCAIGAELVQVCADLPLQLGILNQHRTAKKSGDMLQEAKAENADIGDRPRAPTVERRAKRLCSIFNYRYAARAS